MATNISPEAISQTMQLLRGFEGYESTPYMDKKTSGGNAGYRVGYGSDTITRPDGTVVKVQAGMTISKEDAERDLQRRISTEFLPRVKRQLGSAYDGLTPNAQASLASLAYNYGSVPSSVVAASKSGPEALSKAIAALGDNARRRKTEAQYALGGYSVGGQGSTASASPALSAPAPAKKVAAPVDPFAEAAQLYTLSEPVKIKAPKETAGPLEKMLGLGNASLATDFTKYF